MHRYRQATLDSLSERIYAQDQRMDAMMDALTEHVGKTGDMVYRMGEQNRSSINTLAETVAALTATVRMINAPPPPPSDPP